MPRLSDIGLVIFDFDGVLADSEGIAIEELAAEMTIRGAAMSAVEAQARFLGASTRDHMRFIAERTGRPCGEDFPDVWHNRLFARYATELRAVPGAVDTLDLLDQAGIAYCIGTGGSVERLDRALCAIGLRERFANRAFSAEMVSRGKPAPDLFLHAATMMKVFPAQVVVVEDAPAGILAARAAGMRSVGFVGGSHLTGQTERHARLLAEGGAVVVCPSHRDLQALLMPE
ncbi:MAG: HAD family hydrolase [Cypionkella sp.]